MSKCEWLVQRPTFHPEPDFIEDTYRIENCDAAIVKDDEVEGWECEAGHGYVPMQTRFEQGWDYPDDEFDR